MKRMVFSGLFLVSLLIVAGGGAQPSESEKAVWTMEIIKVKPGMFALTLGYLNDNWMRVREEAKHQDAVLNYHRIVEQGSLESERNIVLLTEFKNQGVCDAREKLFASIRKQLPKNTAELVRPPRQGDLYETVSTRVFEDYSVTDNARFQLLSKN